MPRYGELSQEVHSLVSQTPVRTPSRIDRQAHHKLRLKATDLKELPEGCVLDVLNVPVTTYEFGDLVCGMQGQQTIVGRFLGLKGEEMEVSVGKTVRRLKPAENIGKVTRAEHQGRDFDPNHQNAFARLIGRLTRYGTIFR